MRKLISVFVLCTSIMLAVPVMAQGGNDPGDNWCFDGGPLAGSCTTNDPAQTSWLWLYGFFRAQVAKGALSVNDVPAEYQIGLTDSAISSNNGAGGIRDAEGNIIAGLSGDFSATISTCRRTKDNLYIEVIWLGLDYSGDRIEISTEEGSVSRNMFLPISAVDVQFKLGDPATSITPGGTISIFYRGTLLGRKDGVNGLNECKNDR